MLLATSPLAGPMSVAIHTAPWSRFLGLVLQDFLERLRDETTLAGGAVAGDGDDCAELVNFGGQPERPREAENRVPRLEVGELAGSRAYGVEDDRDAAAVAVSVGDGQRYALAALVDHDDGELSRLCLSCDAGSGYVEPVDARRQVMPG